MWRLFFGDFGINDIERHAETIFIEQGFGAQKKPATAKGQSEMEVLAVVADFRDEHGTVADGRLDAKRAETGLKRLYPCGQSSIGDTYEKEGIKVES